MEEIVDGGNQVGGHFLSQGGLIVRAIDTSFHFIFTSWSRFISDYTFESSRCILTWAVLLSFCGVWRIFNREKINISDVITAL